MATTGRQMRAVVVGASTILGKELAEELNHSPVAAWDIRLLDDREDAEAQLTAAGDEALVMQPLTSESLEGADIAFFAGERETTKGFAPEAIRKGAAVIDLTQTMEGSPGFLVRSPWLQGGTRADLTTAGLVSAHPAALMLALTVDRLQRRIGLRALTATVLEPASEAGSPGLDELHQQTVGLLSFQSVPKEIYDTQVAFNLQSELGEASKVRISDRRELIERHLVALLGAEAAGKVRLTLVQAPVFHGYTVSAFAELDRPAGMTEITAALNGGVVLAEPDTVPSNLAATETGDLLISSRNVKPSDTGCWLWMAADNLRFAARNAVAAALELAALRPASRVQ